MAVERAERRQNERGRRRANEIWKRQVGRGAWSKWGKMRGKEGGRIRYGNKRV